MLITPAMLSPLTSTTTVSRCCVVVAASRIARVHACSYDCLRSLLHACACTPVCAPCATVHCHVPSGSRAPPSSHASTLFLFTRTVRCGCFGGGRRRSPCLVVVWVCICVQDFVTGGFNDDLIRLCVAWRGSRTVWGHAVARKSVFSGLGWGWGEGEPGVASRPGCRRVPCGVNLPHPLSHAGTWQCGMRLSCSDVRLTWLRFRGVVHRSSFRRSASGFTFSAVTISGANANKPTSITVSDIDGDGQLGA